MLTQWFDPEPTFKGLLFAKALKSKGHDIEVITGLPNYPEGKLYPGYKRRLFQREVIEGIRINRVYLYPSHDNSVVRRIINYASFAVTSCFYGIFCIGKADVLYVYHPPLFVGVSGALISIFRRIPMVYDIQDLWPDTLQATGMINNRMILGFIGKLCTWTYRRTRKIVVLSPGFKQRLIERGVPEKQITVVYNWCNEAAAASNSIGIRVSNEYGMDGRFNVVFAGNIGAAQALDYVLKAAGKLKIFTKEVQFVFVGAGIKVQSLKDIVHRDGLDNVRFMPQLPITAIGEVLKRADVLLVHLKNNPLFEVTIPSKTQAYLLAGKPILMAVRGDAADLINRSGAGLCAVPECPESIAGAVLKLFGMSKDERDAMGENGRRFYYQNLSLEVGTDRFLDTFKAACNKAIRGNG